MDRAMEVTGERGQIDSLVDLQKEVGALPASQSFRRPGFGTAFGKADRTHAGGGGNPEQSAKISRILDALKQDDALEDLG